MAAGWHATSIQEAADIRSLGHDQPVFVIPNGVDTGAESDGAVAHYRERAPEMEGRRVLLFDRHGLKRVSPLRLAVAKKITTWGSKVLRELGVDEDLINVSATSRIIAAMLTGEVHLSSMDPGASILARFRCASASARRRRWIASLARFQWGA